MKILRFCLALVLGCFRLASGLGEDAPRVNESRKLQENDTIVIIVLNDPALLRLEKTIAQNGTITYPYLDTLTVKGRTLAEVEAMIRDGLEKDYIIKPQVSVEMKSYNKQFFMVSGKVARPGAIEVPLERSIDVMEAIAMAGDLLPTAAKRDIQLIRKSGEKLKLNYNQMKKNTDPTKRVIVEPEDQIFVGESWF